MNYFYNYFYNYIYNDNYYCCNDYCSDKNEKNIINSDNSNTKSAYSELDDDPLIYSLFLIIFL